MMAVGIVAGDLNIARGPKFMKGGVKWERGSERPVY